MALRAIFSGCIAAYLLFILPARADFKSTCLSFVPQKYVSNSTLNALEYVTNGSLLLFPDNDVTCNRPNQTVFADLCRVALSIPTSNRSSVSFEAWFPEQWSGRFLATGNGGTDGCTYCSALQNLLEKGVDSAVGIKYEELAYGSQYSFAVVGSNNGHNGSSGAAFLDNPDVVEDFAWRSLVHRTTSNA